MFKKNKKESLIEGLYNFLKILAENSRGYVKRKDDSKYNIKRSEKHLSRILGKERLESFIELGFEQGYLKREKVNLNGEDDYLLRIQGKGLKYLEEFERERKEENNTKKINMANWLLLITTIGLLIVSFTTYQIASKSFESENRPYIYVERISLKDSNASSSVYEMEISNFGNFPGRILDVKTSQKDGQKYILNSFPRTTILEKGEAFPLEIDEFGMGNEFDMHFTITYAGVGELISETYIYSFTISVNKYRESIEVYEGNI